MDRNRKLLEELLSEGGIAINGSNPYDIQVKNERLFGQVFSRGSLGLGEAYMHGWWDCAAIDDLFDRILRASLEKKIRKSAALLLQVLTNRLTNSQSAGKTFRNAQHHYDIGNDLFSRMLDKRMMYTCAFWKDATNLDAAQENKLDLSCRKIGLKPGMHVLDIGCGWGGFALYAAEKYGARVTGITVSREQAEWVNKAAKGWPIDIKLLDYRSIQGQFDAVVSFGMFEHVGYKNYRIYCEIVHRCLKDDGVFLLHTIGGNKSVSHNDPWIEKYIFPKSQLPSVSQVGNAIEGLFVMEDWQNFSVNYDRTLMAWNENFNRHYHEIQHKYDETFYRMWTYYLLMCAGSFRARKNQLWQIVLSKKGLKSGYKVQVL